MTDWGATKDRVKGLQAGIDLDMPGSVKHNDNQIIKAIKNNQLDEKDLNKTTFIKTHSFLIFNILI